MGKYFVPHLDPSQVYTPSEYLVTHGQRISFAIKESVMEADRVIEDGERTVAAWQAAFSADTSFHAGVVAVTTHRLLCCSCVAGNLISASMPLSPDIECKPISGFLQKKMPIICGDLSITIQATADHIAQIKAEIEKGIEAAPLQSPMAFEPTVFRQTSAQRREIQRLKSASIDGRRLSKAESAVYDACSKCGAHVFVENKGVVYCAKCNHKLCKKK